MDYGYKTILEVLGEQFDVVSCTYEFNRDIDDNGDIISGAEGGIIYLIIEDIPANPALFAWAMKYKNMDEGRIIVQREGDGGYVSDEEVKFEEAACVGMKISYARDVMSGSHMNIMMSITARRLYVGNKDPWVEKIDWK